MTTMFTKKDDKTITSISELLTNPKHVRDRAFDALLRIANNVLRDRGNNEVRKVSLTSDEVLENLLPAAGAIECLFEMGFVEGSDVLLLPERADIDRLIRIRDELASKRNQRLSVGLDDDNQDLAAPSAFMPASPDRDHSQKAITSLKVLRPLAKNLFLARVLTNCIEAMQYENPTLRMRALALIPQEEIRQKVNKVKKMMVESGRGELFDEQERLVYELMVWFKTDFFSWMDEPVCHKCNETKTVPKGHRPSPSSGADRVELYECPACHAEVQFVRFRDVSRLLVTRCGRCGEFASCFTLMCRAMNWDARLVLDDTDHAWTEVYMVKSKRWVHCDPCEVLMDAPLRYEHGWNKKLSYIMAYSCEEVQDVTWRYSSHHLEVLRRRHLANEEELVTLIMAIRKAIGSTLSEQRRRFVIERCAMELCEFATEREPSEKDIHGRSSGSREFRRARGEFSNIKKRKWAINFRELSEELTWNWGYSSASDTYLNGEEGWEVGVFSAENIQRKVEMDWKMAYLAREERTDSASISWAFTIEDTSLQKIEVVFPASLYDSGRVTVCICAGNTCARVSHDGTPQIFSQFKGCQEVTIIAMLSEGSGDIAWQHTQLFRQPLKEKKMPFIVKFHFNPVPRSSWDTPKSSRSKQ